MELNLVKVTNKKTGRSTYYGVNDKHYDAMLAGEIEGWEWEAVGDVIIEEHVLLEEGFREHGS